MRCLGPVPPLDCVAGEARVLCCPFMSDRPRRWPPPWLFLPLILPGGIYSGFTITALPFLLGQAGVPVEKIANIGSLLYVPTIFYFFWAPLVDMKLRRRTWLVLVSFLSAAALVAAMPLVSPQHLTLVTGLFLGGLVVNVLVSSAQGGLMVTALTPEGQAKASGWTQAGNLGGGAFGAGVTLWLLGKMSMPPAALLTAAMTALPALAALTIKEVPPVPAAGLMDHIAKIGKELLAMARSRGTLWGVLLLAAPVGSGAAQSLLPAVASRYGVGGQGVLWINGVAGGLVLALGSLLATLLPGHWDRRVTYAGAGCLNGLASLVLLIGHRPTVYYAGTILYLVTTGFCYARFTALVMEVLGPGEHGTSTRYSLLQAAGNLPIAYVLWADGLGFHYLGTRGLFGVDAAGNFLVFAVVGAAWLMARRARQTTNNDGLPHIS
jgi:PAT family beta-lactamase induction signal transducer AmpG